MKNLLVSLVGGALVIATATIAADRVSAFPNNKPIEAYIAPATLFRHDDGSNLARIYGRKQPMTAREENGLAK